MIKNIDGFVPLEVYNELMKKEAYTFRDIDRLVFKSGLTPLRYKRNQNSINQDEQYKLFKSHICIVGCGGLGGFVAELLTRIGVGKLTLIDNDIYCEHNLNRQNFSNFNNLGKSKAKTVCRNLKKINPAIKTKSIVEFIDAKNINKFIKNCDIVIDCVDNIVSKKLLAKFCKKNKMDFIHGAIAGWNAQVSTSKELENIYRNNDAGVEKIFGNLVFTVATCASIQTSLAIKLLLKKDFNLNDLLFFDIKNLELINIPTK